MRHRALLLALTLLLPPLTSPQQAKEAAGVPDVALMQQICGAWATLKPENAARYYEKAPDNVFYDITVPKYTGWAAYEADVRTLNATLQSLKFKVNDDALVHHAGKLAWGTATVHTEVVEKNGRTHTLDARWTVIWEKKRHNWLIVHDHFSAPLPLLK